MTPHHLHATRTAWAVHTALGRLTELVAAEVRQQVDHALAAADGLRSPLYGQRHAIGGHADPVTATVEATRAQPAVTTWAELRQRAHDRLKWIAAQLDGTPGDPLAAVRDRIPALSPSRAAVLTRHLTDEDTWIRAAARMPPTGQPLVGVPCPRCGIRGLQVHTDGPETVWTVTCQCVCVGQGCRCGMPGAVEGVQHIWPRSDVLTGAVAGAAPAQTS